MIKRVSILVLFTFFSLQIVAQTSYTLRVDPDNSRGGSASLIFDSIRFTPLETTKESLFGTIDQMEVTDSFFVILDRRSSSILIFCRNGKLHKRITTGGGQKYFSYFAIDRTDTSIVVLNNYANGLLVYDFNGNLKRKRVCPKDLQALYYFKGNIVLYNIRRPFDPTASVQVPFDLAYSKGYDSIYRYFRSFNPKVVDGQYNILYCPINFSGQGGSCMFSLPFDYTVFQINDTGIIDDYKFVFPLEYSLPANFNSDSSYKGKRAEYVYTNHDNYKKFHTISTVYRLGDYILFSAQSGQLTMDGDWNFLYNLKNNDLISFAKATGDSTSCNFPLLYSMFEGINAVYSKKIFSSIPAFLLFSFKDKSSEQVNYPEALSNLFTKGSKNSNPVIVEFNLKPNL
jgi:hypothetical protein